MDHRSRLALAAAIFLALGATSHLASAAPKDAAAQKIDQDAMNNDFLMADFPKAEENLRKAVNACGASGCTPKIKAQILVHLGITQVNQSKPDEAKQSFIEALQLDGSVAPEKDFTTPEIARIFDEAKAEASSGGPAVGPEPPVEPGETTSGEISHQPVTEQMVNTPVPIWVVIPDGMPVGKVLVRYKPFGGSWKKLNLQKKRGGWGGLIPCNDVTTTGSLKYYISVLDRAGDPITGLGSLNKPYETSIKNQLDGDPPALPHEPPPARCAAPEDCPPGLPGCPSAGDRGNKGWGASCEESKECQAGLICKDGMCEEGEEGGSETPSDASEVKRNWVGLYGSLDVAWLSGTDVCGRDSQANKGYACFIQNGEDAGEQYHGTPIPEGRSNAIAGGFSVATARAMLGYDRLFGDNITAGARLGWAFRGGPQPDGGSKFLPLHAEARLAYWFGNKPFARQGVRPYAMIAGGMAQVDAKVEVGVFERQCEDGEDPATGNCCDAATYGQGYCQVTGGEADQTNPTSQQLDAWRKAGQSFAAVGGGVMYPVGPGGIVGELKVSFMFPTTNLVLSPTVGYAIGF